MRRKGGRKKRRRKRPTKRNKKENDSDVESSLLMLKNQKKECAHVEIVLPFSGTFFLGSPGALRPGRA